MTGSRAQRAKDVLLPLLCVGATLYLAREFLMPLAVAILLAFVLAPIVRQFERWHFGRVGSVVTVTIFALGLVIGVGTIVGGQLIDLASTLPKYQANLRTKILEMKVPENSGLKRAAGTLKDLSKELNSAPEDSDARSSASPSDTSRRPLPSATVTTVATRNTPDAPVFVTVVNSSHNSLETVFHLISPALAPLATAGRTCGIG
jgi:predicted PurR-regulated permease PerM